MPPSIATVGGLYFAVGIHYNIASWSVCRCALAKKLATRLDNAALRSFYVEPVLHSSGSR